MDARRRRRWPPSAQPGSMSTGAWFGGCSIIVCSWTRHRRRTSDANRWSVPLVHVPGIVERTMRRNVLIKLILVVVAAGIFGVLFIRSVRNTGAAPYTMRRSDLSGWTLALAP